MAEKKDEILKNLTEYAEKVLPRPIAFSLIVLALLEVGLGYLLNSAINSIGNGENFSVLLVMVLLLIFIVVLVLIVWLAYTYCFRPFRKSSKSAGQSGGVNIGESEKMGISEQYKPDRPEDAAEENNEGTEWKNCREYKTIRDSYHDMAEDLKTSSFIDFFGLRGGSFLRESSELSEALYEECKTVKCRLLVSYPYSDRIEERLRMVPQYRNRGDMEKRWKEIFEDIQRLKSNVEELPFGEVRFHDQPLLFRFLIMEKALYLGFYKDEISSRSGMFRFGFETQMYKNFKYYFDNIWVQSRKTFEERVPQKYSFLTKDFDMMPSLVINLTDKCNMDCAYCPCGGENLTNVQNLCGLIQIKNLMRCFMEYCKKQGWSEKKVIRITGGEPLLEKERLKEILNYAVKLNYQKIVLCTNGLLLKDTYTQYSQTWENVKDVLLLKISLDSLKEDTFDHLTGTAGSLYKVKKNIEFMQEKGFRIELNMVVKKENVGEIEDVFQYAQDTGLVGLKVLTVNDFGGRVPQEDLGKELDSLADSMKSKGCSEVDLYVHNNKGILMKRFIRNDCTLTIVDHMNKKNSLTPRRTYSAACRKCMYYPYSAEVKSGKCSPCATGIMSLTMRADGLLSYCRLREDCGESINKMQFYQVEKAVAAQMQNFHQCCHFDSKIK